MSAEPVAGIGGLTPTPPPTPPQPSGLARFASAVAGAGHFVERRLSGQAPTDVFGYDPELTDAVLAPLLRPLFHRWFDVRVEGLEHIPAAGPGLVAANHSGVLPWDAMMISLAIHDRDPGGRVLRLLGADLVFALPVVADLARRGGATLACVDDAERLLAAGELVGVFPEGYKGIGKLYRDRYTLQRFGRGGFVSLAVASGVSIIPCAVVGAEESHPMLADLPGLARRLGLPFFPLTPTFPWLGPLGFVPLPGRWTIRFGPPIATAGAGRDAAGDPGLVVELTERVRSAIAEMIRDIRG